MKKKDLACPYCQQQMNVKVANCETCGISVEADFQPTRLSRLPTKDIAFLAEYVLSGFSIKEMEKRIGMSYPAIRSRLNRVRENLTELSAHDAYREEVMDRLERGEISADDAITLLG